MRLGWAFNTRPFLYFCVMTRNIEILHKLKKLLQNTFGERIEDVVLFGSQATNRQTIHSDYDVLIITKDVFNWKEKDQIRDLCYDLCLEYEIIIDSKIISRFEIENEFWGKHPLITDAINFGIHAR